MSLPLHESRPLEQAEPPRRLGLAHPLVPALPAWATLLPALAMLVFVLLPPANHDAAVILDVAQRWLLGEALYRDVVDVNPPLIFVLNLLPAAIAKWTPIPVIPAFKICLLGLCWLSIRLMRRLRTGMAEGPAEAATLDAVLPLLLFAGGYDFGQREQMMTLTALPYLILAARRLDGPPVAGRLAWGTAVLAAIGFALKPHFLAVPLAIEALLLARAWMQGVPARRAALRDPVPWIMAAVWAVYLASIPVFFSDYVTIVLGVFGDAYLAYAAPSMRVLLSEPRFGTALLLMVIAVWLAAGPGSGALARCFTLAAVGAAGSAIVQQKGWSYHILPIELFALGAIAITGARLLDRMIWLRPEMSQRVGLAAAMAVLVHMSAVGAAPWPQLGFGSQPEDRMGAFLQRELGAPGARVLVLATSIWPIHPGLQYAGARSTLRTVDLWPLRVAYTRGCPEGAFGRNVPRYRDDRWMEPSERFVWRSVGTDLLVDPPDAILVALRPDIPSCGNSRFDLLAYFRRNPDFAAGFSHYAPVARYIGFELYRRIP
ncbi:hypothetical protein C8P66_117104 [Humitalea rosea]|uniref:4-amino-4-deoxy-L-arabinose transferase-like glycosyltransferase n=1 Tax=Humitalea rosea TaxID=990373 RepID=A0A2W7IAD7_9PROT|nr:hypothetical protein C8P66_117104 [Humitalea rosea]